MLHSWEDDLLSLPQHRPWRGALGFRLNADVNRKVAVAVDGKVHFTELPENWRGAGVIGEPVAGGVAVNEDGLSFLAALPRTDANAAGAAGDGAILAPMPGRVIAVDIVAGDTVTKGQRLVTLEAMKMEHSMTAPFDGTVAELNAEAGAQVTEGTVLVKIAKNEP